MVSKGQRHRGRRELRELDEQLVGIAGTWHGMEWEEERQGRQGPGHDGLRSLP